MKRGIFTQNHKNIIFVAENVLVSIVKTVDEEAN